MPGFRSQQTPTTTTRMSGTPLIGMRSLLERNVYDSRGNYVGKLEEVVMDPRSGCARHAVVAVGGVFGIGCRRLAVPWGALTPDAEGRRCVVDIAQMHLTAVHLPDGDPWFRDTGMKSPLGPKTFGAGD